MTPKARLERIVLAAAEPAEAVATWRRTLGLPADEGVSVRAGTTLLEMRQVEAGERDGLSAIVIEVEDLEATLRHLRSKGIDVAPTAGEASRSVRLDPAWTCGVEIALVERSGKR
jgi:catechol 2,3-dioxygenase-like lactoylglutathione lyase family enzyme